MAMVRERERGGKNAACFWWDVELCLILRWVWTGAGTGTCWEEQGERDELVCGVCSAASKETYAS